MSNEMEQRDVDIRPGPRVYEISPPRLAIGRLSAGRVRQLSVLERI